MINGAFGLGVKIPREPKSATKYRPPSASSSSWNRGSAGFAVHTPSLEKGLHLGLRMLRMELRAFLAFVLAKGLTEFFVC
ncbi:unnamed protein product [Ilex paraguariensis]|uniref:Uncharacterized protein n=1 Tax=Ilex paraguariensis TaxID=185542 RepID=A0ABC8RSL1_9AQUA